VVTTAACGYAHHVASAQGGVVLPEPFSRDALDSGLSRTLDKAFMQQCRDNELAYAATQDLYSLHSAGADLIERTIRLKQGPAHA